jgi:fused signal recognition particle receptor
VVEQMEEVLLTSDVGVKTTEVLLSGIREALDRNELSDTDRVWGALRSEATRILGIGGGGISLAARPTVVMVVGVNGVGKTTTIGKLATKLKQQGKTVVLAAGDTFRAAAVQQLVVWGKRVGCEVVSGKDGSNPGAVIFDAIQKAKDIGADVVLADTAGRLHTKTNLMEELKKVARTMSKALDGAPHETLLVLDATTGQNALAQTAMFKEALPLSGIVLTKLDGTAKGGVILGVCAEHQVPVRYIGIGERAEDLRDFNADEFVEAMLGQGGESADAAA